MAPKIANKPALWKPRNKSNGKRLLLLMLAMVLACLALNSLVFSSIHAPSTQFLVQQFVPSPSDAFVEEHCDLRGNEVWYPPPSNWKRRAPYVMLIGTQNVNAHQIATTLTQVFDDLKQSPGRNVPFLPEDFSEEYYSPSQKVYVGLARQKLLRSVFDKHAVEQYPHHKYIDDTSLHMFHSATVPKAMMCVTGWTKLLIVLQDPVQRAWSHYQEQVARLQRNNRYHANVHSWDFFLKQDVEKLQHNGFLPTGQDDWSLLQVLDDSALASWANYTRHAWQPVLGASLYAIQLRHWFDALRKVGRDPKTQVLIVRSEDWTNHRPAVVERIGDFLELDPEEVLHVPSQPQDSVSPMPPRVRTLLQELLEPYNEILYNLLGDEWRGAWDDTTSHDILTWPPEPVDSTRWMDSITNPDLRTVDTTLEPHDGEVLPEPLKLFGPPTDTSLTRPFVEKWCALNGVDWWPRGEKEWQRRAPYFMLAGVKKSGTTSLAKYISTHPMLEHAATKELNTFLPAQLAKHMVPGSDKLNVASLRASMYARSYHADNLQRDPSLISFDASPGYLPRSMHLPQRILCATPWVKLVVLMREPVSRVYSNWKYIMGFLKEAGSPLTDFESFIERDFRLMRQAGLIQDWTQVNFDDFVGSPEEDLAWERYTASGSEMPVGRSLYAIQLRHWFRAFREIGRDPRTEIHFVQTEAMKKDPQQVYSKVLDFLDIPDHQMEQFPKFFELNQFKPMSNETRKQLEDFFEPYTKRFYRFLEEEGFDASDWKQNWQKQVKKK